MVVGFERILPTELGFLVTFSLAHVRAGCSARQPSGQPRGFSSKIFPLFKILKICSKVSAVKECHIVGIVAKLHVFYEIAFGKLYGLELVFISFWAIIWHGIGLWIHPGIKQSRGSAVVKVSSFAFLRRRAVFWVSSFRSDVYPVFPARP